MVQPRLSRRVVATVFLALFFLGVFILVNSYRSYRVSHHSPDQSTLLPREKLPEAIEAKGRRLAWHDFESWNSPDGASHFVLQGHGGKQSLKLNSDAPFSPGLWIRNKELNPGDSTWLRATGYVWFSCRPGEAKCSLVATCNHNGTNYKYMSVPVEAEQVKPGQWNRISIDYHLPPAPDKEDVIQVYFWYRGNTEILVDDILIEMFTHQENNHPGT